MGCLRGTYPKHNLESPSADLALRFKKHGFGPWLFYRLELRTRIVYARQSPR